MGPLGRPVARYRSSWPLGHICFICLLIIAVSVAINLNDSVPTTVAVITAIGFALVAVVYLGWTLSAYLVVHEHGVEVGRRFGRSHHLYFAEIHPATLREVTNIGRIRVSPTSAMSTRWHFTAGATGAVTFLGPDLDSVLVPGQARVPAPQEGLVLFGTNHAAELVRQLRAGMERVQNPPMPAPPLTLVGSGWSAREQIPGYNRSWQPPQQD